jgi:H+/Cl- antiporter ClcA
VSIDKFVHNPPSWIVAILIAGLTAHAIDKLIELVKKNRGRNGLIIILELFIVFVLGFLALHSYYEGMLKTEQPLSWDERPFALVVLLVLFALGSMALYIAYQNSVGHKQPSRSRQK